MHKSNSCFKEPYRYESFKYKLLIEQYGELKDTVLLTKNKWDGEDLAQETVCKVLQKYRNKDICMTLVYKIARNRWLDQIKSKSVHEKKRTNHF